MGCWQETCCVSGLSIKEGDPIRFALVSRTDAIDTTYAYDLYKLWTPMFKGTYDDYGFADDIEPKEIWEWWMQKIGKGADRFDRLSFNYDEEEYYLRAYICHEWAFDEVKSYSSDLKYYRKEDSNKNRVKAFLERLKPKTAISTAEQLKCIIEAMRPSIDSYSGGFMIEGLRKILGESPPEGTEQLLVDTADFVWCLPFLRKGVAPNLFFGAQTEDNKWLTGFTQLVADKAVEQNLRYNDDEDGDEDD